MKNELLLAIEYILEKCDIPKEDAMSIYEKIRKPTAPATIPHKDKNRYNRKEKHKSKTKE